MSNQDELLAIHNFNDLKSLANNAKITTLLKFLLRGYNQATFTIPFEYNINALL